MPKKLMLVQKSRRSRGFTLIELLVVTLVISILLTVGAVAFRGASGKGITAGRATSEALFDQARTMAVGRGTLARVLIDVDDPDSETYLRRMIVAYAELDDDGKPQTDPAVWVLENKGYTLPDGVYYSREFSRQDHEARTGTLLSEEFDFDGTLYDGEYVYYEFNSEGICTTGLSGSDTYAGPSFVIGSGARPKGQNPRTTAQGRRSFEGFVIWRNGSTSIFRNPDQILDADDPTEF